MKCQYCNNQINNMNVRHIYRCCDRKDNLPSKDVRYNFIKYNYGFVDYDFIHREYVENNKSLPDFNKEYNINSNMTLFLLDYFGIKKRTLSESNKTITSKKNKEIFISKYGVDNVSKLEWVKEKKRQTFIKNYGVDNIWKSSEYKEWLDSYMVEKYGSKRINNPELLSLKMKLHWKNLSTSKYEEKCLERKRIMLEYWSNITPEERDSFVQKCTIVQNSKDVKNRKRDYWLNLTDDERNDKLFNLHNNFISGLEVRFSRLLKELGIEFYQQRWILGKCVDFLLKGTNVVFEINGDFWHANPEVYKMDDILNFPKSPNKAKDIWKKDADKIERLENNGYIVFVFWEKDIRKMTDEDIKILILLNLKWLDDENS